MKTRIFSRFLFAVMVAVSLGSCTADEFEGQNSGTPKDVQKLSIEVTTGSDQALTRSTYATSAGTVKETFETGDEIGVYGLNGTTLIANNVKFTLNAEGNWEPEADVTYSTEYYYYAYYPYQSSATLTSRSCSFAGNATVTEDGEGAAYDDTNDQFASFISHWPIAADQSDVNNFRASDLLAARGQNQAIPVVKFTMAHKMAMIELVPSYNYWYYTWDQTTAGKQTMGVQFSGNIPYELDGNFYYICRPNTNTTVGGQTLQASSGKFYYKRLESAMGSSYSLSYSTDGGSSFGGSKPSWLNISEKEGETYTSFLVSFNNSGSSSVTTTLPSGTVSDYDLSLHDVNGNSCSRTTANSYMVHKGGTYKLPLVYGNAIKNGAYNTSAYAPSGSGSDFLSPFKSALDNDINDPYISNVDGFGTGATADLLWQDANRVISAVGISGDYLTFTVPESAPCGNAVVAVKNSAGVILWSWHIWACPDWYKTASLTPVKSGDYTYDVAPVNLGWVGSFTKNTYSAGSCVIKMVPTGGSGTTQLFTVTLPATEEYVPAAYGYCPYYQWGRKDPEQPSTGNANSAHAVYNVSGGSGTALTHSSSAVSIGTTIKNPTVHYYNSANYGPYSSNQYNLWDANESQVTSSGNYSGYTVKTIYDPCPPGYCVPRGNLYYYMTNGGTNTGDATWNGTTFMRSWTKVFPALNFPAAGRRYYSGGTSIGSVSGGGYCWASSASSAANARDLRLGSSDFYWGNDYRAYGFTVRPVAEK